MRVGVRANTEADEKSAYNNVQVGDGAQQREIDSQFLQTMKLGWDDEINFAKISFLSHSHQRMTLKRNIKVWCHNFLSAQ